MSKKKHKNDTVSNKYQLLLTHGITRKEAKTMRHWSWARIYREIERQGKLL